MTRRNAHQRTKQASSLRILESQSGGANQTSQKKKSKAGQNYLINEEHRMYLISVMTLMEMALLVAETM